VHPADLYGFGKNHNLFVWIKGAILGACLGRMLYLFQAFLSMNQSLTF
jgi:hypothetical protein